MNAAHVALRWPGTKPHRRADVDCVITRDVKISPATLQDFSAQLLTSAEQDLVIVAGAIAYADRMVNRQRGNGWARDIVLTIPVRALLRWPSQQ